MRTLIELGLLEQIIKEFEDLLSKYNQLEQGLILQQLQARHNAKKRQQMTADLVGNMPLGGLFGRIKKGLANEDNER